MLEMEVRLKNRGQINYIKKIFILGSKKKTI